jgi:uncharacterized protein YegJ (DUF2314 family)
MKACCDLNKRKRRVEADATDKRRMETWLDDISYHSYRLYGITAYENENVPLYPTKIPIR